LIRRPLAHKKATPEPCVALLLNQDFNSRAVQRFW
jgi:hypothetical protein